MKKIIACLLCLVIVFSITGCGGDKSPKEITILTFPEYVSTSVANNFTNDTGIKVNMVSAETNEEIINMLAANPGAYDMVIASEHAIDNMVKKNLLQEINTNKIENYKYVNPGYTGRYYDPENRYSVPYSVAGLLIGYNPEKAGIIIDSYADLLAPDLKKKVVFANEPNAIMGIANMVLGNAPEHEKDMENVAKILNTLAGNSYALPESLEYPEDALISGDAVAGLLFTSQVGYAMTANPQIEVVYPKEGFIITIDSMVIPAGADGAKFALQFMNYLHDPEVNGKAMQEIGYSPTNISGKQFMDKEYRNDGYAIKPDEAENGVFMPPLSEAVQERFTLIYNRHYTYFITHPDTAHLTQSPTDIPTDTPNDVPTSTPTNVPTSTPADTPSNIPADVPADIPTLPTENVN